MDRCGLVLHDVGAAVEEVPKFRLFSIGAHEEGAVSPRCFGDLTLPVARFCTCYWRACKSTLFSVHPILEIGGILGPRDF